AFRLTQNINESLRNEAMEELKKSRDPKAIAKLVEILAAGADRDRGVIFSYMVQQQLVSLGDKNGDVYDVLLKNVEPGLKLNQGVPALQLAEVMAATNPDKAMKQIKTWLDKTQSKEMRNIATHALGSIPTKDAMNLAIDLMSDKDVGTLAMNSVRN